ncbi:ATP-binding protein [Aliiroseovarius sp. S1339]|uniref:ATP-binding protein n=1 Tax=Aliiroseovarius sp. S1339 TaxID=2936990 RepID=UPI0020BDEE79|nr:ATP-binding protein [Aliiroseovarius sp. S1339]MCK8464119.1 ATP-binding protein [Aliiroseovarius sp. S1339]
MKLVFPADPVAVRGALKASMSGLTNLNLTIDERGVIEIVLAEVLNNVVEHAYAHHTSGVIELRVKRGADRLHFTVLDDGVPLPDDGLPETPSHSLAGPVDDLPEGGFGWFLIKELTQDLNYVRSDIRNRLDFTIALADTRVS